MEKCSIKKDLINNVINDVIEKKKIIDENSILSKILNKAKNIEQKRKLTKLDIKKQKKIINTSINGDNILFPLYNTLVASTKTIIAVSNFTINLDVFYTYVPITPYVIIPKKRGRKSKINIINVNENIIKGLIISVIDANNKLRGVKLKNKKKKFKKNKDFFRHSVSVVMVIENKETPKFINTKISKHGKFQLTGCKYKSHAIETVNYLYSYMRKIENETGEKIIEFKNTSNLEGEKNPKIIFNTVMKNFDFNLGFKISRENLHLFVNGKQNFTNFYSIYEESDNNECNIKHKANNPYNEFLTRITIINNDNKNSKLLPIEPFQYIIDQVPFSDYISSLDQKEQIVLKKKIDKKQHTFMIFHSGSIIVSGSGKELEEIYNKFMTLILQNKHLFQEKLDM